MRVVVKASVLALGLGAVLMARPVRLRVEYQENPLGIDAAKPKLSWQSDAARRNWRQGAYQILVASTAEGIRAGNADVWDSGKQMSAESAGIEYGGPVLESRRRYWWTVRVWDEQGVAALALQPAWWEMGILRGPEWTAQWITRVNPEEAADRSAMRWTWIAGRDALAEKAGTKSVYRLRFDAPAQADAVLYLLSRVDYQIKVNGRALSGKAGWTGFDYQQIGDLLKAGSNEIELDVTVRAPQRFGPNAGVAGGAQTGALATLVKLRKADGTLERIASSRWEAKTAGGAWAPVRDVAAAGDARLGKDPGPMPGPAALFRRSFRVAKAVKSARAYVTALGSYRLFLNGKRVGNDALTPEFTDYGKRVLYQTYDVTSLVARGENVAGAMLADGWFGSGMTWTGNYYMMHPPPSRLIAQIHVTYVDGSEDVIGTDGSWKSTAGPVRRSEIYGGEDYDARREPRGWDRAGFADSAWTAATIADAPKGAVTAQNTRPVRVIATLQPKSVKAHGNGAYIFDLGQNMVGGVALRVAGTAGTKVRLRFAEILNPDGGIYTQNLRNADATDVYTMRGGGPEVYRPMFTFHGFRYVEVTGYPGTPAATALTGEVLSSVDESPSGRLETASHLVNRMWAIGLWGQRGNYLSIPTDCPQRDERLGWTGDAGAFWRTGAYNFDAQAFTHKWMNDMLDGQSAEGVFPNVAPDLLPGMQGAPGWGDAGVIVPWTTWMQYGDRSVIEKNWQGMERWMDFIAKSNPDFIRKRKVGPNFADWLAPDPNSNKDLIATAYWAQNARMMAEMAKAIGRDADAQKYTALVGSLRESFQKAFVKADGEVANGTQTSYVLALQMNLLPENLRAAAVDKLVKAIEKNDGRLSTGFLGTPHLLFALADNGRVDVAYKLLLSESYPSWGYMLSKGATTWWERWNSDTGDPAMNSFNHYAFGSVVAWVYRYVAGIDTAMDGVGFRKIVVRPRPNASMPRAHGEYDSVYGKIVTDWNTTAAGGFALRLTVPANASAEVYLPAKAGARITEGGKPVETRPGPEGTAIAKAGSGVWVFEVN